jgi:hypothetical protein
LKFARIQSISVTCITGSLLACIDQSIADQTGHAEAEKRKEFSGGLDGKNVFDSGKMYRMAATR